MERVVARQRPCDLDRPVIFLDNDGVLTDADAHHAAYCRRYGELMAPRFGGTADAWGKANSVAFHRMMDWYEANAPRFEDATFFEALYRVELGAAFEHLGKPPPDWETEGRLLMGRLLYECPLHACALLPGAREAVEALAQAGYGLCMASNAHSLHCEGVLSGCGLRNHFICAFGPDLVNCPTKSVEFYRRICTHVGIPPEQAVLVDDNAAPLAAAAGIGMTTILIGQAHARELPAIEPNARLAALTDLPGVVARLTERCCR
jgi:HAD superfamily hydrolase (TIGR01509 family)